MNSKLAIELIRTNQELKGQFKVKIFKSYFEFSGPANLESDFKFLDKQYAFNIKTRRMENMNVECVMALDSTFRFNRTYVRLGLGFLVYIYAQYDELLDEDSKTSIKSACLFDLDAKLYDLYPTQQEDLKMLFHYKRGIFQCYTGYGKTQVIAVLMDYIVNVLKESVVVLVPDTKPKHELVDRYEDLTGNKLPEYYDTNSSINVLAVKGFLRSNSYNRYDPFFKRVKWVLADEVEYCMNNSGIELMDLFINADKWYGFSATPDKKSGNRIWIDNTKSPVITRNFDLVNYFGFSTVFRKPDKHDITITSVVTDKFNNLDFIQADSYPDALRMIFMDYKVCKLIRSISKTEKPILIPFPYLEVIDFWIEGYFNDMKVINICSRGYEYYESGKLISKKLTLDQVKEFIESDKVDVITGTASVYRALDFRGISNILPLTSKLAGIVIQSIGRIARDTKFKIICIDPTTKVPMYTGDLNKRKKLIKDYYSDCRISRQTKSDVDYGFIV